MTNFVVPNQKYNEENVYCIEPLSEADEIVMASQHKIGIANAIKYPDLRDGAFIWCHRRGLNRDCNRTLEPVSIAIIHADLFDAVMNGDLVAKRKLDFSEIFVVVRRVNGRWVDRDFEVILV